MAHLFRTAVLSILLGSGIAAVPLISAKPFTSSPNTTSAAARRLPSPVVPTHQWARDVVPQKPASILLQTSSPGDVSGLLPVQGTLGVSDLGCVTLTDRIERVVVVSADGQLSTDGLRVLIPGEGTLSMGDYVTVAGWTRRNTNNLPRDHVPRARHRCEPGPYVFLDPT